jgi:hypothetical protein
MSKLVAASVSIVAAIVGLALVAASSEAAISLHFDTLKTSEQVNSYYDGGFGNMGSGPGPDFGVTFAHAFVLNEFSNNEGLLVTPPNSISFFPGPGAIMDALSGFATGFSFNYSAPFDVNDVTVWSGLDGTGSLLATLSLTLTPDGAHNPDCFDGHNFCPVVPFGVTFAGTARSVNFGLNANTIVFDDITLGSSTPVVPEPSTWTMMLFGLAGLGLAARRKARRSAGVAA